MHAPAERDVGRVGVGLQDAQDARVDGVERHAMRSLQRFAAFRAGRRPGCGHIRFHLPTRPA